MTRIGAPALQKKSPPQARKPKQKPAEPSLAEKLEATSKNISYMIGLVGRLRELPATHTVNKRPVISVPEAMAGLKGQKIPAPFESLKLTDCLDYLDSLDARDDKNPSKPPQRDGIIDLDAARDRLFPMLDRKMKDEFKKNPRQLFPD